MPNPEPSAEPQYAPASPAPAPWQGVPQVAAEVQALRQQFRAPDLCVAEMLCDRHPQADTAFILADAQLNFQRLSYGELAQASRRLASGLAARGIVRGARVGVLMAKTRQLPIVLLALWRLGAVHVPLFTAFAGPAIAMRVQAAQASLIVSDPDQAPKLAGIDIPVLESGAPIDLLIDGHQPLARSERIGPDGIFLQLYTSGTTGAPKGVPVPAFAIASFIAYMRYGFDVRADDLFWNGADPGWAYGLYYAVVGPLAIGRANVLLAAGFSSELTRRVVDALGVNNFASAPTVYRALRRDGVRFARPLRVASSAGEPLTPDITAWSPEALGATVLDHWGQTEQGMGIVNCWDERLRSEVRPGSMGQALPGFVAGTVGDAIALSVAHSPLMWFKTYVDAPDKTAERFTPDGQWYLTGDAGRHDGADFFFASRDDDVILAAGYRISPFDLESIIAGDPAVAEVAVVGRRHAGSISGEVIEAFVVLGRDADTEGLAERLQRRVREHYGAHAYPRHVHFVTSLPKTPSGKVRRVELRALGDDEIRALGRH
ncbi:MAG: AMP-binding protein [Proteobacteria bacterium]|nr:AMP-binding protein [Pseudomonadota bacterium]